MIITYLSETPNRGEYGSLVSFLRLYSTKLSAGECQIKTLKELASEFFGSDDKKFTDRIRVTIYRLNRKEKTSQPV